MTRRLTLDVGLAGGIAAWRTLLLVQVNEYAPVGAVFLYTYVVATVIVLVGAIRTFRASAASRTRQCDHYESYDRR